ncbi:haloacid dehalogenase [Corynebacterium striatum]|uniref:HAD family hydrolase n=1 Tax=Corynebacterium striatum TaxID=43770 RepID=UPI000C55654C|nr:HAD-IIB family hydrolase [Corynebacterium striatum]MBD0857137.1 HAD family phosphatase [Corynebacterium striatum]PIS67073.1 haloacid dehalogenase [Corynebacterium striatum]PXY13365.1 haloacid dehalogenase [Corynebacterium striatum]PXY14301.1 haloacid dehalogenase [Corynebacterium striatum]
MKLAAFDLDGTVYFDGSVPDGIAEEIAAWRAAGNLAVVATGKSAFSARRDLRGSGLEFDYYLLCNGTVIMDGEWNLLYESHVPPEVVEAVYTKLHDVPAIDLYCTRLRERDGALLRKVEGLHNPIIKDPVPVELNSGVFPLVAVWTPGQKNLQLEIASWVRQRFNVGTAMNRNFFDITPPGHDKGFAINWLLEYLQRPRAEMQVITFGDGHNDLPMHALADVSVTFPWAAPEVQAACDVVAEDVITALRSLEN